MSDSIQQAQSILIVRLGAIGDALRVCPAVRRLRRDRPGATIGWAVEHWVHPLLAGNPNVDRFHVLDRSQVRAGGITALREWRRFLGEIRRAGYEVALDFHGRFKSGVVTRLSGARWRVGYPAGQSTEGNHFFTNVKVRLDDPLENRVQRFLHLLEPLGTDTQYDHDDLGLPLDPECVDCAGQWYAGAGQPELAVYPGTSRHQQAYHRWPADKWVALLKRLSDCGVRSVAFWGPDEEAFTASIVNAAGGGCALAPATTLPEMLAMVGRFRVFAGTNTAAMHMAWMQGVPTAVFTGPADPRTDAPMPPVPSRVLRAHDQVRPGVSKRRQPSVVAAVPVDEAFNAVMELLEGAWKRNGNPSSVSSAPSH